MPIEEVHARGVTGAPTVLRGFVAKAPENASEGLYVVLPSTANPAPFGPMPYPARNVLPVEGQEVVVVRDETGNPSVVCFIDQDVIPAVAPPFVGELRATVIVAAPTGWLLCQGQEELIATYPALYEALGSHELAGAKFAIPDLRNRSIIGSSGTHALGTTGGAEKVTLSTGQMPAHTHTPSGATIVTFGGFGQNTPITGNAVVTGHEVPTSSVGGGEAHENMPPFYAGNWLIYHG